LNIDHQCLFYGRHHDLVNRYGMCFTDNHKSYHWIFSKSNTSLFEYLTIALKKTQTYLQNTTQKTINWDTRARLRPVVNSDAQKGEFMLHRCNGGVTWT
jgi:hypothetical protein